MNHMKTRSLLLILMLSAALLLHASARADSAYSLTSTSLAGASAARLHNIARAAAKLHGMQLPRGQVFSFNDLVGPRTRASGYQKEPNGVGNIVYGGGVSQIATTLDKALAGFDGRVEFLERHTWGPGFTGGYVSSGDDAIRVSYSEGYNYAFTDNMQTIQIDVWIEDQQLHCLVKGKGDTPYADPLDTQDSEAPAGIQGATVFFASLQSYDPATRTGMFDEFEMLRGDEAVDFLVRKGYYDKAEAQGVVDGLSSDGFVPKSVARRHFDLGNTNFLLRYQPDGAPAPDGVPSNSGDFRAIYDADRTLLMDTCYYRIHVKGGAAVYLEQFPWP